MPPPQYDPSRRRALACMGYRFAVFNHATRALGGSVTLERFELSTP